MLSTFIISFREFFEAFLIVGVFFGLSKKLKLKREKEILLATACGIGIALILPILTFIAGDRARNILTERNADMLAGYLMIFSGFFLAYVIFSLHTAFVLKRSKFLIAAHQKLEKNIFDFSLFMMIVFFVVREGFEIALFTATTSLFSRFAENFVGLVAGFAVSSAIGVLTYLAYIKFPISKIYKATEYLIILLGAAFVKNGIGELAEVYFGTHLSKLVPINLNFLPADSTLAGHMIKNMIGLEQGFSLASLGIMVAYILCIYFFLIKKRSLVTLA